MIISKSSPAGNIFSILGTFKRLRDSLMGDIDVSEYDNLLKNYKNMTYDDILKKIEKITNGTIKFVD